MTYTTEELQSMLDKATPGPWQVRYERGCTHIYMGDAGSQMCDETYYPWVPENLDDWELISAAPDLAARVLELEDTLEQIAKQHTTAEVAEWDDVSLYAWDDAFDLCVSKARAALKENRRPTTGTV